MPVKEKFFLRPELFLYPLILVALCVGVVLFFASASKDSSTVGQLIAELHSELQSQLQSRGVLNQQGPSRAAFGLAQRTREMEAAGTKLDAEDTRKLIQVLEGSRQNPSIQQYAVRALGRLGKEELVLPVLEGILEGIEPGGDHPAGGASRGGEASRGASIAADDPVRVEAICGLGLSGSAGAVPLLATELEKRQGGEDWWVRVNIVQAMLNIASRLGSDPQSQPVREKVREILRRAIEDPHPMVAWNVAIQLAEGFSDSSGVATLRSLLDPGFSQSRGATPEQGEQLQRQAIAALGALGDEDSLPAIRRLSQENRSLKAKDAALRALSAWGTARRPAGGEDAARAAPRDRPAVPSTPDRRS